jgi:hypothetical protein
MSAEEGGTGTGRDAPLGGTAVSIPMSSQSDSQSLGAAADCVPEARRLLLC